MIVSVLLDKPHAHFTNLDILTGRVILRNPSASNVSSIVVKLEGESRTRLFAATRPERPDRQRPVLEVHKILYKPAVLFPLNISYEEAANARTTYALNAGQYEYPFQFKLPLNNSCLPANSLATNVSFTNLALEVAKQATHHVKQTLPPSLSGFPGEAEIRYYVKVTVNRPSIFKENPRASANFTFLPIEPPRPVQTDGEAYARRTHQFLETGPSVTPSEKKKGFFDSFKKDKDSSAPTSPSLSSGPLAPSTPPRFTVDARLPNPAILTCNRPVPLRILVKNNSSRSRNVYLQMLQVELIGYTKVQAHEVQRTESNSWIVASMSNMAIPLGSPTDPIGTEVPINPEYWADKILPNTVAPTFQTCNIARFYELEVRVGLGYGSYKHGEDQLVVLPLRLPVKVYSGIAPPPALLDAMASGRMNTSPLGSEKPKLSANTMSLKPPPPQQHIPHTPVEFSPGAFANHSSPPVYGMPVAPPHPAQGAQQPYDDAPPSYEDAVGQNLPPISGYRGEYQPPPVVDGDPGLAGAGDSKRG